MFCERAIGLYEMREKHAKAEIIQSTNAFHDGTHQDTISRKDRATYIDDYDTHRDLGDLDLTNAVNLALNSSMAEYIELFPTLKACSIRSTRQKIQKTLPKEGYHVWHLEHGLHCRQPPMPAKLGWNPVPAACEGSLRPIRV